MQMEGFKEYFLMVYLPGCDDPVDMIRVRRSPERKPMCEGCEGSKLGIMFVVVIFIVSVVVSVAVLLSPFSFFSMFCTCFHD